MWRWQNIGYKVALLIGPEIWEQKHLGTLVHVRRCYKAERSSTITESLPSQYRLATPLPNDCLEHHGIQIANGDPWMSQCTHRTKILNLQYVQIDSCHLLERLLYWGRISDSPVMLMANAIGQPTLEPPCQALPSNKSPPFQGEELHEAHATTDVDDQNLMPLVWMDVWSKVCLRNATSFCSGVDPYITATYRIYWVGLRFPWLLVRSYHNYHTIQTLSSSHWFSITKTNQNTHTESTPWADPFNFSMPITRTPLSQRSPKMIPPHPYLPYREW